MGVRHVLLLTDELATVAAVSSALESNGKLDPTDVCRDLGDLKSRLDAEAAPAVLVDIDSGPSRMLSAIEPLARRFADTRFIVLSGAMQSELLLEAMQVGARHFMMKASIPGDLAGVLKRLCPPSLHGRSGSAITILSAGGGGGATTVAVNLATELASLDTDPESEPPLIVDLDHHYGAVSTYLAVDGEYGVLDLLNRAGPIDAQLVQSTALASSQKSHVLISSARGKFGHASELDPNRIGELVGACKASYRWTLLDAPRVSPAVAAELALRSDVTFLLMQLTIKDIRVARQMLTGLTERGVLNSSVRLLVTRYRRRGSLFSLDQAREAMGLAPTHVLGCLSNDYRAVSEAVNLGKPLAQAAPRSDFRRELQKLAASLAQTCKLNSQPGVVQAGA
jgi:pilus assembly protein CpaE